MIFSMKEKFEENDLLWDRYNGGWMKTVTGLDKSVKNGYSLLGEFVDAGATKNDYEAGLYINCNITGSRKNQEKIIQLIKLTEDEEIILLKEIENAGRSWAVEFWELIEENLEEKVKMSVGEILKIIKDNLTDDQVEELVNEISKPEINPVKVNLSSFTDVVNVDNEMKEVIKENKFKFKKLTYTQRSEVLGLAIIKYWESIHDFKEEDINLEFIADEHIRKGDVIGYTCYITEKVDGFAKIENGKISLKLLY